VHDSKEKAKIYTIYITDKEQDKLREEQQRNSEISEFKWYEMKISND
jgi:hypothetical protein